jgi:PAS domain S-box-containing protein
LNTLPGVYSEADILYDLSMQLTQPISSAKALLQAISRYPREQGCTAASLIYTEGDLKSMPEWAEVVASVDGGGADAPDLGIRYPLKDFPFTQLWFSDTQDIIVIEDMQTYGGFSEAIRGAARQAGRRASIILPLYYDNRWIGVIVYGWTEARAFTEADRRLYKAIGQQACWRAATLREAAETHKRLEQVRSLESKLQSSQAELSRLASVIQETNDFVGIATPDGKGVYVNRAGLRMAGVDENADVTTMSMGDFHPAEHMAMLASEGIPGAIQHGTWRGEGTLLHRDGRRIPISQVITSHKTPDGQLAYLGTIIRDTTEEQRQLAERERLIDELAQANAQVQRNEEQLRQVIEYAPQSIAMFDSNMRYLVYNKRWITGFGLDANAALMGKSHYEVFPEIGDDWKGIHQRALQGIVDTNEEAPFPRADGSMDWVRWDVRPWYQDDGEVGGIIMNTDVITERINARKERESLIRQLREASRFKDEFLAMMSHELRTPLNAMIGLLGIVLMGTSIQERDRNMITRARSNSERLLLLINNILDISRMEAGRLEIVKAPISLRRLVEKFNADMSILAAQKDLRFNIDLDPALPESIVSDDDALNKIITNLVGNAFKFTEKGEVTLKIGQDQGALLIQVRDTGIGIPAHMQEIIFESFRQADQTSTRAYGGSGLGLSIVSNLCSVMGGTVRVESTPGQGSTFIVTLPLEAEQTVPNTQGAQ